MNAAQAFIAFLRCEATQAEKRAKSLRATAATIEANSRDGRMHAVVRVALSNDSLNLISRIIWLCDLIQPVERRESTRNPKGHRRPTLFSFMVGPVRGRDVQCARSID